MRIAIGSDEATELTTALVAELEKRGHAVLPFGPLAGGEADADQPVVPSGVAEAVARGEADEGIVCCWTGTGASIAANKVPGIRAALIGDAQTARGARLWNHANVLALGLRATPVPVMREILDAWFATPTSEGEAQSEWNRRQIERLRELEERYGRPPRTPERRAGAVRPPIPSGDPP
ncbi:MAG: RpiB/LacA/LacB family sugar-phosphate isomerase [Candidatus Latescibacterota bacterium]